MRKNKKGFVGDIAIYVVMIFVIAISLVVVYMLMKTLNTAWQADSSFTTQSKTIMSTNTDAFVGVWDNFMVFMVLGLLVVIVILGFALRTHPVFAGFAILFMIIVGILAVNLANTYRDVATDSTIVTYANDMEKSNFIMEYLPHLAVVCAILFIIIVYSKANQPGI